MTTCCSTPVILVANTDNQYIDMHLNAIGWHCSMMLIILPCFPEVVIIQQWQVGSSSCAQSVRGLSTVRLPSWNCLISTEVTRLSLFSMCSLPERSFRPQWKCSCSNTYSSELGADQWYGASSLRAHLAVRRTENWIYWPQIRVRGWRQYNTSGQAPRHQGVPEQKHIWNKRCIKKRNTNFMPKTLFL
jgi:hypothetical protein